MTPLILRWRWVQLGGHVHVRVFTGTRFDGTFEKSGELVFDAAEWLRVAQRLDHLAVDDGTGVIVQIKHEHEV